MGQRTFAFSTGIFVNAKIFNQLGESKKLTKTQIALMMDPDARAVFFFLIFMIIAVIILNIRIMLIYYNAK